MKKLLITLIITMFLGAGATAFAETVSFDHWDTGHGSRTNYVTVHDPVSPVRIDDRDRVDHGVYWVNTWKKFSVKGRSVGVETDLRKRLNNTSSNEGMSAFVGLRTEWP